MYAAAWLEALKQPARGPRGVLLLALVLLWASGVHRLVRHGAGAPRKRREDEQEEETTCVSQKSLPFWLAIVAGWYDVVCFKQYKCYANMMSGNTLNLCMKVGNGERADVALISAAIAHFIGNRQKATRAACRGAAAILRH